MLIEFSVENFKSIKEKATLSMLASNYDKSLKVNLIENKLMKKNRLLRYVAIFGANASGKSNVVGAIDVLRSLVLTSHNYQRGQALPAEVFKLDDSSGIKPVAFNISFIAEGVEYEYSLKFNRERVVQEHLYHYPNGQKSRIFTRDYNGSSYEIKFSKENAYTRSIKEMTTENVLLLSNATKLNHPESTRVFDWFSKKLITVGTIQNPLFIENSINMINSDETHRELILKALIEADVGIDSIRAKMIESPFDNLQGDEKKIVQALRGWLPSDLREIPKWRKPEIVTDHHGKTSNGNDMKAEFAFNEESQGTQRLFALIGTWIQTMENDGVLVFDELDSRLHHLLSLFLIRQFQNENINKGGQLIFTTHDACLLDEEELLRRDQVWFTNKDYHTGNTELYSLLEFKPRNDKNILKGYILGRYGAIPFIKGDKIV